MSRFEGPRYRGEPCAYVEVTQAPDGRWIAGFGFVALGPRTPGARYDLRPGFESEAAAREACASRLAMLEGPLGWRSKISAFCRTLRD